VTYRTLHPSFESVSVMWRRETGVVMQEFAHGTGLNQAWIRSPFAFLIDNGISFMRRHLSGAAKLADFSVLEELVEEGATDYFAMVVRFDSQEIAISGNRPDGIATSWATDRPGGFAEEHLEGLQHLVRRLAVACKLAIREQIARNVASTYLGETAGHQVLTGHIKRGDYETIDAVVWGADLRDSTGRIERLGMERYLALLNGFLECAAGAVQDCGGEILAYPGDAVLAIFRADDPANAACAALESAAEFRRRVYDVNENLAEAGAEPLRAGLGIHRGELAFGNIGTGGRQAFTAIGPAVNVVNRLETMTKNQPYPVILSDAVVGLLPDRTIPLTPLGEQFVRGSELPLTLFGAAEDDLLRHNAPAGYSEEVLGPSFGK
jgi:adenylate cyclase